jgi:hypothetical protein
VGPTRGHVSGHNGEYGYASGGASGPLLAARPGSAAPSPLLGPASSNSKSGGGGGGGGGGGRARSGSGAGPRRSTASTSAASASAAAIPAIATSVIGGDSSVRAGVDIGAVGINATGHGYGSLPSTGQLLVPGPEPGVYRGGFPPVFSGVSADPYFYYGAGASPGAGGTGAGIVPTVVPATVHPAAGVAFAPTAAVSAVGAGPGAGVGVGAGAGGGAPATPDRSRTGGPPTAPLTPLQLLQQQQQQLLRQFDEALEDEPETDA